MKNLTTILMVLFLISCNSEKKTIQHLESLQNSDKAEKHELGLAYMQYISKHGKDIAYSKSLVRKLLANSFFIEAIYTVEMLQESFPQDPELLYLRGLGYRNQHQYDLAIEDFNYAIKIQPQNKIFLDEAKSTLEELSIWHELQTMSESLSNTCDSSEILLDRAQKLFSIRQYDAVLYDLGSLSKMGSLDDSIFFTRNVSSLYQEGGNKSVEILTDMIKYYRTAYAKN